MPGKFEMLEVEKAFVTCASEVSRRGRLELTSTVELISPTCKLMDPRPRSAPSVTSIFATAVLLNPAFETSRRYVPIDSKPKRNRPARSLVTVTVSLVAVFTIFIDASVTDAPSGSTMLPETDPLDTCASTVCWLTNDKINIKTTSSDAKQKQDLPVQFLLPFLEIDATLRFIPTPLLCFSSTP